ncbi:DUF7739 domain-containing protein [Streptomyces sp. Ju416(a)]|uniref:DUF7739 domain-containing protein n=1 Tax=Streptomyces sp. Ju416(a) TaxID=3446591 RepID=UPI00403DC0A5
MSRKHAIHAAEAHVVTSHGADFFGEDRHPLKALQALGPYAQNSVAWTDRPTIAPLVQLLEDLEDRTFPPADAAQLSEQLLVIARARNIKAAVATLARALADAAARAAADSEPWEWRIETA